MAKFFQFYLLASALLFSVAGPALAANCTEGSLQEQLACKAGLATEGVNEFTLSATLGRIIKIVLGFVGTIFFALTVYAGFLWMTAEGNEDQVTKSKDILKTAVIGMIIVVAAYSITAFVLMFTAQSTTFSAPVGGGTP